MKEDGVCGTADEQGWRFWYLVSPTATQPPPPITSSCCCMSLSPTQCHPAQTEHFTQVCITHSTVTSTTQTENSSRRSLPPTQCRPAQTEPSCTGLCHHSMPSCTEHFTHVCITHSMRSCSDRAFHAGLYHPLNAILHRQSISCRSLSPTQCRPAQTEHFMQVFITHSMPSCTDRAFHAGLCHLLNAVLHRQSISCRSVSPTQCRPAQTEHFTGSLSPTHCHPAQQAVLSLAQHRPSISHMSLSPTQCQPAQ